MAIIKQVVKPKVDLIPYGMLGTLASATYTSWEYNQNYDPGDEIVGDAMDVILEVKATIGSNASSFKQMLVFAQASLNVGTSSQSGPTSGTTATDELDLTLVGVLPMATSGTHMKTFSIFNAFGYVPPAFNVVLKNETGVVISAYGVKTAEVIHEVV